MRPIVKSDDIILDDDVFSNVTVDVLSDSYSNYTSTEIQNEFIRFTDEDDNSSSTDFYINSKDSKISKKKKRRYWSPPINSLSSVKSNTDSKGFTSASDSVLESVYSEDVDISSPKGKTLDKAILSGTVEQFIDSNTRFLENNSDDSFSNVVVSKTEDLSHRFIKNTVQSSLSMKKMYKKHVKNKQWELARNQVNKKKETVLFSLFNKAPIKFGNLKVSFFWLSGILIGLIIFIFPLLLCIFLLFGISAVNTSSYISNVVTEEIERLDNELIEYFYDLESPYEDIPAFYYIEFYPNTNAEDLLFYLMTEDIQNNNLVEAIQNIHSNLYFIETEYEDSSITFVLDGISVEEYFKD